MKKLFKVLVAVAVAICLMPIGISAQVDDGPACLVSEGWSVISKSERYVVEKTVTLKNSTSIPQVMAAQGERSVYNESSTSVDISVFESVLGVSSETRAGNSYTTTESTSPTVPAHTTYYVDFGHRYVYGTIQKVRINEDCSKTYIGERYTAEYTVGPYIEVRE